MFAVLAVIALAIACMILYVVFWHIRNLFSPVKTVSASVVRKKAKQWDALTYFEKGDITVPDYSFFSRISNSYSRFISRLGLSNFTPTQGTNCYMTFSVNSKELEFSIPLSVYLDTEEGTEGMLTFQGERFKSFIPMTTKKGKEDLIIYRSDM